MHWAFAMILQGAGGFPQDQIGANHSNPKRAHLGPRHFQNRKNFTQQKEILKKLHTAHQITLGRL
jgi:hypothetical protein